MWRSQPLTQLPDRLEDGHGTFPEVIPKLQCSNKGATCAWDFCLSNGQSGRTQSNDFDSRSYTSEWLWNVIRKVGELGSSAGANQFTWRIAWSPASPDIFHAASLMLTACIFADVQGGVSERLTRKALRTKEDGWFLMRFALISCNGIEVFFWNVVFAQPIKSINHHLSYPEVTLQPIAWQKVLHMKFAGISDFTPDDQKFFKQLATFQTFAAVFFRGEILVSVCHFVGQLPTP